LKARALLAAVLLLAGPASLLGEGQAQADAWRAKASPALLGAFDAGEPWLRVVLQGPPASAPAEPPATRAAWSAHWERAARPALGALADAARALGGAPGLALAAEGALFAGVPSAALPALLARSEVRAAGLDRDDAVRAAQAGAGAGASLERDLGLLGVPDLWERGYRGEGVRLAIVDTGLRATHDVFRAGDGGSRVVAWYDATAHPCASPCDLEGHGTHTAGTAAGGSAFNASAPPGAAPRADLVGVRILEGNTGSWEDAAEGLQAAFDLGAEVASNSWGGPCGGADDGSGVVSRLAAELSRAGMVSVFAAGNLDAAGILCPGAVPDVVTVGAADAGLGKAWFSGRGPCRGAGEVELCPDVLAVGVDVEAAWGDCDSCYATLSGTSMATPQVAGLLALLQEAKRAALGAGLDSAAREPDALLRGAARDLGAEGPDELTGWGLAQGERALDLLLAPPAPRLADALAVDLAVLHLGDVEPVAWSLLSLGGVPVRGRLTLRVDQVDTLTATPGACPPACWGLVLFDGDVALAARGSASRGGELFNLDLPPADYVVAGDFHYAYADPETGAPRSGALHREGLFTVRRVVWELTWDVPSEASSGRLVHGALVLRNVGNADAAANQLTLTLPTRVVAPAPLVPPGVGRFGLLADTPPDEVASGSDTLTYTWVSPTGLPAVLHPGARWAARFDLLGAQPGEGAFELQAATLEDGVVPGGTSAWSEPVAVRLPL
jgi:subtilisin family serine protease